MSNDNQQLLISQISNRPFCADNFIDGVFREFKDKALKKKHIQLNNNVRKHCMTFDLDYEMSFLADDFADLPSAHLKVRNNDNGHTHLTYFLETPVFTAGNARIAPMRYFSVVENHFRERLSADPNYTGLITKNPFSKQWFTSWSDRKPYSLDYLAEFVRDNDNTTPEKAKHVSYGIGRNVNLFESLRLYAYRHVLKFKKTSTLSKWYAELELQAVSINIKENINNPLPYNEIKSTSWSIARWTWQNFNNNSFSKLQSERAKKKAIKTKNKTKNRILNVMGEI